MHDRVVGNDYHKPYSISKQVWVGLFKLDCDIYVSCVECTYQPDLVYLKEWAPVKTKLISIDSLN